MLKRICLFTVGLFVMSLGVAFSIVSTLGTTPISSISYSLALITNINIGITTFVFNAALILIQFLILRSKFKKKRLLQFINCVLFGYFTDLALYLVSFVPFDNTILFSVLFSIVTGWRFSTIKIAFDATMVIISLILCGLFYTSIFGAVNVGTIISAFMVGFTLRQISNLYFKLTGKRINVVNQ